MILSGRASQSLAAALADRLDEQLGAVTYDRFPDGEQLVSVPDAVDGRAVVVASTASDAAHVEVLQLQDAAREAGASEVVTVLPYMGYARQDEAFEPGQPVSARAVARAVGTGTDRVLVVSPHEDSVLEHFGAPATAVDGGPALARALAGRDLADPLFLAPDAGAVDLARTVRDAHGAGGTDHFRKTRDRDTGAVSITPGAVDVGDRDVVLVDDIVATGSTTSEAVRVLADRAPRRVFVACVHPLFAGSARSRLARAGVTAVWGTDTIEAACSTVTVADELADEL